MKPGAAAQMRAAAQLHAPIIALFAMTVLVAYAPGAGIGFIAALAFGLALLLHALVFGAAAAKRALPPTLSKLVLAGGVCAAFSGAAFEGLRFGAQLSEAVVFAASVAGANLILLVVFGRAPTLRDADW